MLSTYHDMEDGWYLACRRAGSDQVLVTRTAGHGRDLGDLFHPRAAAADLRDVPADQRLTGSGREIRAARGGRIILRRQPEAIYTRSSWKPTAAGPTAMTEDEVREAFSLITTEWTAGDS